jgi:hypothetical protein
MEHAAIETTDLVGRYRAGRLGVDETAAFEEHLLHCTRCLDAVECDDALAQGLRMAAAEDALRASRPVAVLAWLARLSRSRQVAALAAALLVALFLPLAWQQQRLSERTRERDAARRAVALSPAPDAHAASAARERLERQLDDEIRSREALAERLERALAPQANTPILRLSPLRGVGGAPADRLHLPKDAGWVVLSLELPPVEYPSYRVRLKRAGAPPAHVLSQDGLTVDAEGSLALAVHASMLVPGDYEASVQGVAPRSTPAAVGRFVFRVE